MKPKIIVHCLVKNEERFIWYALQSVLPFVDKVMVWDTGSSDKTIDLIKSIKSSKISLKEVGEVNKDTFTSMRQQMLDATPEEFTWVMILDGDEVWPKDSIKKVTDFAKQHSDYDSIVVRTNNLVGDIYHRLSESAGKYTLAGHTGHLNLRFMNLKTIPGLNAQRPHGQQGYFDKQGTLIQNRDPKKIKLLNVYYHHASHLIRSSSVQIDSKVIKRKQKFQFDLGRKIPHDQIPAGFFADKPNFVPDVTQRAKPSFYFKAAVLAIPKRIKRLFSFSSGILKNFINEYFVTDIFKEILK